MRTVGSIVAVALLASTAAQAGDAVLPATVVPVAAASNDATVAWQPAPYPADWDKRIGDDFWTRFINYYALEWGHDGAPPDPTAPPGRRAAGPAGRRRRRARRLIPTRNGRMAARRASA